jgi:hypothetical protein
LWRTQTNEIVLPTRVGVSETLRVNPEAAPVGKVLLEEHFLRKHGPGKCYGQE